MDVRQLHDDPPAPQAPDPLLLPLTLTCSTSMSMTVVLPWCRWPTTATLRTSSGLAMSVARNSWVNRVLSGSFSSVLWQGVAQGLRIALNYYERRGSHMRCVLPPALVYMPAVSLGPSPNPAAHAQQHGSQPTLAARLHSL